MAMASQAEISLSKAYNTSTEVASESTTKSLQLAFSEVKSSTIAEIVSVADEAVRK